MAWNLDAAPAKGAAPLGSTRAAQRWFGGSAIFSATPARRLDEVYEKESSQLDPVLAQLQALSLDEGLRLVLNLQRG